MTKINIAAVHEADPRAPYAKSGKGDASLLSQTLPFTPKRYTRVHRYPATHNTWAAASLSLTLDLSYSKFQNLTRVTHPHLWPTGTTPREIHL